MRVFAGPNGSGKSTLVDLVKRAQERGRNIDLGVYVNADDITRDLLKHRFRFRKYKVAARRAEFHDFALNSGLIGTRFTAQEFRSCHLFTSRGVRLRKKKFANGLAQIIADFLRSKLLKMGRKFSFETVFSHAGKLEILRQAVLNGYKVYLYYIATESPDINIERVKQRVLNSGHDVPVELIRTRYERSLNLMFEASQNCYQAYFFDSSKGYLKSFAHFKVEGNKKKWDKIKPSEVPFWFYKYYSLKTKSSPK